MAACHNAKCALNHDYLSTVPMRDRLRKRVSCRNAKLVYHAGELLDVICGCIVEMLPLDAVKEYVDL